MAEHCQKAVVKIVFTGQERIIVLTVVVSSQFHQLWITGPFTEQELPRVAAPGDGGAVGKVDVLGAGHMHVLDVGGNVAYFRFLIQLKKMSLCHPV